MRFNSCAFLPSSSCIGLTSVVGFLASNWKAEAALIAAVCFVCIIGLAAAAEEARKKARWKARLEAWPAGKKRAGDPGMVRDVPAATVPSPGGAARIRDRVE